AGLQTLAVLDVTHDQVVTPAPSLPEISTRDRDQHRPRRRARNAEEFGAFSVKNNSVIVTSVRTGSAVSERLQVDANGGSLPPRCNSPSGTQRNLQHRLPSASFYLGASSTTQSVHRICSEHRSQMCSRPLSVLQSSLGMASYPLCAGDSPGVRAAPRFLTRGRNPRLRDRVASKLTPVDLRGRRTHLIRHRHRRDRTRDAE